MRIEIGKVIPEVQFYLSFEVLPSNPEAVQKVNEKLDNMTKYALSMEGLVEYQEEKLATWSRIFNLTHIAKNAGCLKIKD